MNFASDNWAGAAPEILEAVRREAVRYGPAYGVSDLDRRVESLFDTLFERKVAAFAVATGTAANAISLAALSRPGGVVLCHSGSHILEDECGAVEFQTGGGRLMPVGGPAGKLDIAELERALDRFSPEFVHAGQPMAVSITQATESGTVYSVDEVARICASARARGLPVHMDGSRFANAVARLGCAPADLTWRAGVDVLSFGGTKNGCLFAEAVIVFDPGRAHDVPYLRKRAGQLFSKTRLVAAQLEAYLEGDRWLAFARHANGMADRLRAGIAAAPRSRLGWPSEANELFAVLKKADAARLREAGATFYDWHPPADGSVPLAGDEGLYRLVTSFATTDAEVDAFLAALG
ncbi:threonine aldolase family protein [Propylenella binzhouense]|uniref:L-threonine aldolase n=1 Tax=Propylenella binzhouense TaxID=2555902 RepID=A0A964T585_9HYPH|nr:low specificity L-threonine aldolase [Propylenella binzhouense]MYZ48751.1 low specificity L-threonine aldolase [Propylenella binzhouense]